MESARDSRKMIVKEEINKIDRIRRNKWLSPPRFSFTLFCAVVRVCECVCVYVYDSLSLLSISCVQLSLFYCRALHLSLFIVTCALFRSPSFSYWTKCGSLVAIYGDIKSEYLLSSRCEWDRDGRVTPFIVIVNTI